MTQMPPEPIMDIAHLGHIELLTPKFEESRRFFIDVEFRPEHDPKGHFYLSVDYLPWSRDERGRRLQDGPVVPDASVQRMHQAEIASYAELIEQLETWIARCSAWAVEGN